MNARWANPGDTGPNALERVQRSLTVNMVMTPRAELQTCRRDEIVSDVIARNTKMFSFLPVVDEKERFLGLYRAERWFGRTAPSQLIGDDFEPFSEDIVIGADANIIDFVKTADERPTRLVVSGDRIAGLVSRSDLQLLPVRAALFTLITCLEMTMAERIEQEWGADNPTGWLKLLSGDREARIRTAIDRAKKEDGFVSEISFCQLHDKATIIRKERLIPGSKMSLKRDFNTIVRLRDAIAHANYYAETPQAVGDVCAAVRAILRVEQKLFDAVQGHMENP